jgi:hypothetical protein
LWSGRDDRSTSVPEKAAGIVREIKRKKKSWTLLRLESWGPHTHHEFCFCFVEKGADALTRNWNSQLQPAREFRYHIWCPSKSVTMLDALASQLALYIEPCCWWHHSSYYIHPLKQWHR